MNKLNSLDWLGPITDEMLAGLHADQQMKARIRAAASGRRRERRMPVQRALAPALCCAALALVCVGAVNLRGVDRTPQTAKIDTIAAGEGAAVMTLQTNQVADLGDNARVRTAAAAPEGESLFAQGQGDIPLVAVDGAVYRMLTRPQALSDALRGGELGRIALATDEPSLAGGEAMQAGLSNVAAEGAVVYGVRGLSGRTAVAVEVDGCLRVFQRVSYAGKGPGGQSLEDTFDVRGKVKRLELSGVGALEGEAANSAMNVLLGSAVLKSADASGGRQTLTVTLDSGLRLQLGVSGDTVTGCGGWSCPEFFDAFEAAL